MGHVNEYVGVFKNVLDLNIGGITLRHIVDVLEPGYFQLHLLFLSIRESSLVPRGRVDGLDRVIFGYWSIPAKATV